MRATSGAPQVICSPGSPPCLVFGIVTGSTLPTRGGQTRDTYRPLCCLSTRGTGPSEERGGSQEGLPICKLCQLR